MHHVSRCLVALIVLVALILPGDLPSVGTDTAASTATGGVLADLDVQPAALTQAQLTGLLDRLQANGVRVVSTGVNWGSLQPTPADPYQWAALDGLIDLVRQRGMLVRLRVAGSPAWLHPDLTGVPAADLQWYPPTGEIELAGWSTFMTDLTRRYADRLAGIEIWNEPNESWFWKPAPDPAAFAALQRASYLAVKRVAPALTVTSGGLSHNDLGFLSAYYDAAAGYPDATANRWFFDQLGLHPYAADRSPDRVDPAVRYTGRFGTVDENFLGMRDMVDLVATREGAGKHVWISEFGYTTQTFSGFPAVPDGRRAYYLNRAFTLARDSGFVDGIGWYHSHPTPWDPPGFDVLPASGETETFAELARVTGARSATRTLTLALPAEIRSTVRLDSKSAGLSPAAARTELYVDGLLAATGSSSLTWDARATPAGPHTVQLVAWSRTGTTYSSNRAVASITH